MLFDLEWLSYAKYTKNPKFPRECKVEHVKCEEEVTRVHQTRHGVFGLDPAVNLICLCRVDLLGRLDRSPVCLSIIEFLSL